MDPGINKTKRKFLFGRLLHGGNSQNVEFEPIVAHYDNSIRDTLQKDNT